MSKETIWDYKPTEEEVKKICERLEETQTELTEVIKRSERYRFGTLLILFEIRKDSKNSERTKESWLKYQKQHPFRDRES